MERILREKDTFAKMIRIYCKDHHRKNQNLCADCYELNQYLHRRVDTCKYGKNKPVCKNCKDHCYKDFYHTKIRQVMCHSGPKMLRNHPILAVQHALDKWRYK